MEISSITGGVSSIQPCGSFNSSESSQDAETTSQMDTIAKFWGRVIQVTLTSVLETQVTALRSLSYPV